VWFTRTPHAGQCPFMQASTLRFGFSPTRTHAIHPKTLPVRQGGIRVGRSSYPGDSKIILSHVVGYADCLRGDGECWVDRCR